MRRARHVTLLILLVCVFASSQNLPARWIYGSEPCSANTDAPFQVHAYNEDTYIIRQNKCIHYEAPFIYVMFGQDRVFVQDTGAAPPADSNLPFPIQETVQKLVDDWSQRRGKNRMQILITHSHAHGDHIGGDSQFLDKPNTVVAGTKVDDVQKFFGFRNWPADIVSLDLGERVLDIIPIPGHEPTSIAVYDQQTRLLLTGDTLYPGRLYIRDWEPFKASIERLATFVKSHPVAAVLGTHIEMTSKPGVDYPVRTTFQPDEHGLALKPDHILELHEGILKMNSGPIRETHNDFIIYPR